MFDLIIIGVGSAKNRLSLVAEKVLRLAFWQ